MEIVFLLIASVVFLIVGIIVGKMMSKSNSENDQEVKSLKASNEKLITDLSISNKEKNEAFVQKAREEETVKNLLNRIEEIELTSRSQNEEKTNKISSLEVKLENERQFLSEAQRAKSSLEANLKGATEKLETQKTEIEKTREEMINQFKIIATDALAKNTQDFTDINQEKVGNVLTPLKVEIEKFQKKFEEKISKQELERGMLTKEIEKMNESSNLLQKEAEALAKTLKGNKKAQGDWGEDVLRTILENSGLQEGLNFEYQYSQKDAEGNQQFPDVVVKFPSERRVVIDSKVSYGSYHDYINNEEEEKVELSIQQLVKDVKSHVDRLSRTDYEKSVDGSLDFIMMFMPMETALIAVMRKDSKLWQYAYERKVLLIGPTNLISALKLVENLWIREKQNLNTISVMNAAENIFKKFNTVLDHMHKLGNSLNKTVEYYNNATGSFATGKGSMKGMFLNMKELGVTTKTKIGESKSPALINENIQEIIPEDYNQEIEGK